jgi:CBS domain containing-hemolysin-like protein
VPKLSQFSFVKKWSAVGVCREKAALSIECEPTGDGWYASAIASASAFLVVSYVFADLASQSIALSAPVRTAMLIASQLRLLIFIARPFLPRWRALMR